MLALALAALQAAAAVQPPPAAPAETWRTERSAGHRLTVPVTLDGRGPFGFVVDTGAERTVISRELADTLGLPESGSALVASATDIVKVPTVAVAQLDVGRRSVENVQAPILLRQHLGADGLLGIDSLQDLRVDFDFEKNEMHLSRYRLLGGERESGGAIVSGGDGALVLRGSSRMGRLILGDARVEGQQVQVVVDTGSAVTIGNRALQARLARRDGAAPAQPLDFTSVTGGTLRLHETRSVRIEVGAARFTDLPIGFAEVRLFEELGLADRPAILLGMDALRLFRQVSIDFKTRRIRLVPGPRSQAPDALRMAGR
jgi:predicted aspartyl protease